MAIYQRDRNFHKIFAEIDVAVIPLKFIKDVTCYLSDGRKIVLDGTDFDDTEIDDDLEKLIKDLDFYENLTDLKIRIDYGRVEKDVENEVEKLLNI